MNTKDGTSIGEFLFELNPADDICHVTQSYTPETWTDRGKAGKHLF